MSQQGVGEDRPARRGDPVGKFPRLDREVLRPARQSIDRPAFRQEAFALIGDDRVFGRLPLTGRIAELREPRLDFVEPRTGGDGGGDDLLRKLVDLHPEFGEHGVVVLDGIGTLDETLQLPVGLGKLILRLLQYRRCGIRRLTRPGLRRRLCRFGLRRGLDGLGRLERLGRRRLLGRPGLLNARLGLLRNCGSAGSERQRTERQGDRKRPQFFQEMQFPTLR